MPKLRLPIFFGAAALAAAFALLLPHAAQRYVPSASALRSFPENGASVPRSRST